MSKGMKIRTVLSLFDGISAGRVALERANISYDNYYASEIDKYAISITQHNYPNTIQLGDVTKWREWDIDWSSIDLLFAGFPCQSWSLAGQQKGDEDPRGKLLWVMLEIREHILKYNPNLSYLFENVNMKKEFQEYINKNIGVTPHLINSGTLSAQNRKRLYWTNIPNVEQPEDKNIYLYDILLPEEEIEERYYIKNIKEINWVCNKERIRKKYTSINTEKAITMTARQYGSWNGNYFCEPVRLINIGKGGQGERVYYVNAKSTTLSALGGWRGAKTGLYLVAQRGRNIVDGKRKDYNGAPTEQRLETRVDLKTNTLTTVQKDNYVLLEIDNQYYRIRKLHPKECEALQTMPKDFTKYGEDNTEISDTQRYKALGNSWTVDVIAHILSFLGTDPKADYRRLF